MVYYVIKTLSEYVLGSDYPYMHVSRQSVCSELVRGAAREKLGYMHFWKCDLTHPRSYYTLSFCVPSTHTVTDDGITIMCLLILSS